MVKAKVYIQLRALLSFLLCICLIVPLLTGCSSTKDATLWVVTEQTTSDSFNYQIEIAAEAFEAEHTGMTVQIDILPTDEEEREIYLKQLRAQIMAGKGPDIYILPTSNIITIDAPAQFSQRHFVTHVEVNPLFQDIEQAMHNGIFADIGRYYDADKDLDTEGLVEDVMSAGVIAGHRYVLPLRYTMPIILSDPSNYAKTGINQDFLNKGIRDLTQHAISTRDTMMAIGLRLPDDTTLLSKLYDYGKGEVLISKQEIADYMHLYQQWYAMSEIPQSQLIAEHLEVLGIDPDEVHDDIILEDALAGLMTSLSLDNFNNVQAYGRHAYHWTTSGFPLYTDTLTGALHQAGLNKILEKELDVHPLKTYDGKTIAEVTYYGAVGASCEYPELAYNYLRKFLTTDYQWDLVRPRAPRENIDRWNLPREPQIDGFIENSWPVRATGSAAYLWDTLDYQLFYDQSGLPFSQKLMKQLKSLEIRDEDIPILNISFDEVRFPLCQPYEESLSYALSLLNNEDRTPTDVDIDELAEQVYQYLWWHLAEG